jgi:LPXTG-site transpeptidase (sortase) family protein
MVKKAATKTKTKRKAKQTTAPKLTKKKKKQPTPRHSGLSRISNAKTTKTNKRDSERGQNDEKKFNTRSFLNSQLSTLNSFSTQTKLLFLSGALLLLISLGWHLNQTVQLMFFPPSLKATEGRSTPYPKPTQIIIPKVSIDLPVEQTAINKGVWQVSEKGASHLTVSARPGEKGTIIMYSHNTNERFGPIRWLSKGDMIQVKTADGKTHAYKITQTMTVAPNKMDIFTQNKGETLILYTCDGFADLQRFVLLAVPAREGDRG